MKEAVGGLENKDEGLFHMSLEDWRKYFTVSAVCFYKEDHLRTSLVHKKGEGSSKVLMACFLDCHAWINLFQST